MKLVTKFLTTTAAIYLHNSKYVVLSNGILIFTSNSKEMCVSLAINKAEILKLEQKTKLFIAQVSTVEKELIYIQ